MKTSKTIEKLEYLIEKYFGGNQSKFARELGIAPQTLTKYLSGERNIGYKTIKRFENLEIDINIDWLFNDDIPVQQIREPKSEYITRAEFESEISSLKAKLYDLTVQKDKWKNFAINLWNYTQTQLKNKDSRIEELSVLFGNLLALDGTAKSEVNNK